MKYLKFLTIIAFVMSAGYALAQKSTDVPGSTDFNVFVPNAFTPNSDGHNDVFKPIVTGPELAFYELTILNRDGKPVFVSNDPSEVWDGTVAGSPYVSSPTLYIYFLKVKSVEDMKMKLYSGHIVMIR